MIGLVDYDLFTSTSEKLLVPNLEIMKLATYYKIEENIFCRLLSLHDTELSAYEKIYFFSETSYKPEVPSAFLRANNVIYGGTAFTEGIYKPFKNSIIDYTIAKPNIYKNFLKEKYDIGIKTKVIEHVLDDSYYRIFIDDKLLPSPPILPKKRMFIYDRNLFQSNWVNVMTDLNEKRMSTIFFIHPIICHTLTEFITLRSFNKISRTNVIILDINIPLSEVYYMLKTYKNIFLADINKTSQVGIYLGGTFPTSFQYYKDFTYKINLLYSFWAKGIELKIKYNYPKIGYNNPIENLEKAIVSWTESAGKYTRTLNQKITKHISKELAIQLNQEKELLLKFEPSAKDLFEQTFNQLKQGGYWRL